MLSDIYSEPLLIQVIAGRIFPLLRRHYQLSPRHELSMQDAFLVKYDASSKGLQRHLSTHMDSSQLSFNIALSTPLPPDPRVTAASAADFTTQGKQHLVS